MVQQMELQCCLPVPHFTPKQSFDLNQSHHSPTKIPILSNYFTYLPLTITRVGKHAGSETILFHNLSIKAPLLTVPDHSKNQGIKTIMRARFMPKSEQLLSLFKEPPVGSSQIKRITICGTEIDYVQNSFQEHSGNPNMHIC